MKLIDIEINNFQVSSIKCQSSHKFKVLKYLILKTSLKLVT